MKVEVEKNRSMILKIVGLLANRDFTVSFSGCIENYHRSEKLWCLADHEIMIWRHIFGIDQDVGKKLLAESKPYQFWLEKAEDSERPKESPEHLNYLCYWIKFLKEWCPERLSDFIELI